jgi:hypothetical protein
MRDTTMPPISELKKWHKVWELWQLERMGRSPHAILAFPETMVESPGEFFKFILAFRDDWESAVSETNPHVHDPNED